MRTGGRANGPRIPEPPIAMAPMDDAEPPPNDSPPADADERIAPPDVTATPAEAAPPGGTAAARAEFDAAYLAALEDFNGRAFRFVGGIADEDKVNATWRRVVLHALAAVSVIGGLLLAWAAIENDNPWVAGVVGVAALAVIGLVYGLNPLQTVERDVIYRRWSDTILASFFLQAGSYDARLPEITAAAALASAQYEKLGLVHQATARVSADTLGALLGTAASTTGTTKDEKAGKPATAITLTTPADVKAEVGKAVAAFEIAVTGPDDLALTAAPLPAGIALHGRKLGGTPTATTDGVVTTVTATSASLGKQASATFSWTVAAAPVAGS
jgi:hypothetical protein